MRLGAVTSVRGGGPSTFEVAEPRDHQAIGLARERRRQNRVTLRVAGQLLGKRNQLLAAKRRASNLFGHFTMMSRLRSDWQPQRFDDTVWSLTAARRRVRRPR
jgi:hypothetical protein